jgi:cobalt-zinc-cadmium efflux system membrane fusion protein
MNARIILALITTFMAFTVFAAAEPEQLEERKGPHGGKLLQERGFSIEVTIFESGIPPEMRLYVYRDAKPLPPEEVTVNAALNRLGGEQDIISFQAEQDYLVGDKEIVEPHSFDVELNATHGTNNYHFQYDSHEGRTVISDRLMLLNGGRRH